VKYSEKTTNHTTSSKVSHIISQDYVITNEDKITNVDNYFDFEKKLKASGINKSLSSKDKKFILIEKKTSELSEVYTDEEWNDLINTNDSFKLEKMVKSLSYGIPEKLRGRIWIYLAKSVTVALNHDHNIYYKLLNTPNETIETRINNDIDRTLLMTFDSNTKAKVKSKEKLYNVLKAYAIYDHQVDYCQGTNFIVAVLLRNIPSERYAFWTFVQLMYDKNWRYLFLHNTPKLIRMLELFLELIKKRLYDVYLRFKELNIIDAGEFNGIFTHYFMTIFCGYVPVEYANRILDMFWIYEEKIIFEALIHLLRLKKDKIIKMSWEDLMVYLKSDLVKDCMRDYGLEKSLPQLIKFEEKEVNI